MDTILEIVIFSFVIISFIAGIWTIFDLIRRKIVTGSFIQEEANPENCGTNGVEIKGSKPSIVHSTNKKHKEIWRIEPWNLFKEEYVSYPCINTYQICPRMFELVYLCGFEDRGGRAAQLSNIIHKVVSLYTLKYIDSFAERLKINRRQTSIDELLNFFDQAVSCTDVTFEISKSELILYLTNFVILNSGDGLQVNLADQVIESTFSGYKLKGVIDRIDDGPKMIDYKSGNPKYATSEELNLYAFIFSEFEGGWIPMQLEYQFLKNGKIRHWMFSKESYDSTIVWLKNMIEKIEESKNFPRHRSGICGYCRVAAQCERIS